MVHLRGSLIFCLRSYVRHRPAPLLQVLHHGVLKLQPREISRYQNLFVLNCLHTLPSNSFSSLTFRSSNDGNRNGTSVGSYCSPSLTTLAVSRGIGRKAFELLYGNVGFYKSDVELVVRESTAKACG